MTLSLFGDAGGARYRCLVLDPPWPERGGGKYKRGADAHYPVVGKPGNVAGPMARVITASPMWRPDANAHLWMWTTDTYLPDALAIYHALRFRYVRTFPWVKARADVEVVTTEIDPPDPEEVEMLTREALEVRYGIGQYARGAHELLLFGVCGKGQSEEVWQGNRDVPSVIIAPVPRDEAGKRIHSRKPEAAFRVIERVSKGPRVEFFQRLARPGWDAWGNEVEEA